MNTTETKRGRGRPPKPTTKCAECDAAARAKGLCWNCYQRQRRREAGAAPRPAPRGLTEVVRVSVSPSLLGLSTSSAAAAQVPLPEWFRRAALYYLAAGAPPVAIEMADDD